jgi:hypothetical protein
MLSSSLQGFISSDPEKLYAFHRGFSLYLLARLPTQVEWMPSSNERCVHTGTGSRAGEPAVPAVDAWSLVGF